MVVSFRLANFYHSSWAHPWQRRLAQSAASSLGARVRSSRMEVKVVPCLEDNYAYVVMDKATKEAAVVDPVQPDRVLAAARELGADVKCILCTHHHWDHAGGNQEFLQKHPGVAVIAGDARVPCLTRLVKDGEVLEMAGSLKIAVMHTPCHTSGSVSFVVSKDGDPATTAAVFTGDTLFLGGCGRFFEGTAAQMLANMRRYNHAVPSSAHVYCGHEYTVADLEFAKTALLLQEQHLDSPRARHIEDTLARCVAKRKKGEPTVPMTLGEMQKVNPFLGYLDPSVRAYAASCGGTAMPSDEEVIHILRELKNAFKAPSAQK